MKRTDIINAVIAKNGYGSYLEIGVRNPADNYNRIRVMVKQGADPNVHGVRGVVPCTSDEYFKTVVYPKHSINVIFVDGDHSYPQCTRDMVNAYNVCTMGGVVILHDTLPKNEAEQVNVKPNNDAPWCGQAWRSVMLAQALDLDFYTVDCDHGVTVIHKDREEIWFAEIEAEFKDYDPETITPYTFIRRLI